MISKQYSACQKAVTVLSAKYGMVWGVQRNMVKLLIVDVDGTLTDGTLFYGNDNSEIKTFNTKDGAILIPLYQLGIEVILLTGLKSKAVIQRARDLGITAIQGIGDKLSVLHKLLAHRDIRPEQCAYIGDDLNDYAAMKLCGFKACPADAAKEILEICDYVSPHSGGHGAVRDICTVVLRQDGKYDEFLKNYRVL